MLPAIVIILSFIGALVAFILMLLVYAVGEHSKYDYSGVALIAWLFVVSGCAICGWQTIEVINTGLGIGVPGLLR